MQTTSPITTEDLSIPGPAGPLALRVYRPSMMKGVLPLVLYFHGGGFVGGSLDDADAAAGFIAEQTPALVIAVDYALAPARPFPAAPEDAHATALWCAEHASALGADPTRMAVAGDDAGGNLAPVDAPRPH